MSDRLDVYEDQAGEWRWRRVSEGNNEKISSSNEWFPSEYNARRAAERANPDFALRPLLVEVDALLWAVVEERGLSDKLKTDIRALLGKLEALS